jgi:hypothetical protein
VSDVKYAGPDDARLIASGTNPWVQVNGEPVNWMNPALNLAARTFEPNDCEGCAGSVLPGALEAMDTPEGIQRCDTCQRFDGDLFAAQALADCVGGEVWFTEEEDRCST